VDLNTTNWQMMCCFSVTSSIALEKSLGPSSILLWNSARMNWTTIALLHSTSSRSQWSGLTSVSWDSKLSAWSWINLETKPRRFNVTPSTPWTQLWGTRWEMLTLTLQSWSWVRSWSSSLDLRPSHLTESIALGSWTNSLYKNALMNQQREHRYSAFTLVFSTNSYTRGQVRKSILRPLRKNLKRTAPCPNKTDRRSSRNWIGVKAPIWTKKTIRWSSSSWRVSISSFRRQGMLRNSTKSFKTNLTFSSNWLIIKFYASSSKFWNFCSNSVKRRKNWKMLQLMVKKLLLLTDSTELCMRSFSVYLKLKPKSLTISLV